MKPMIYNVLTLENALPSESRRSTDAPLSQWGSGMAGGAVACGPNRPAVLARLACATAGSSSAASSSGRDWCVKSTLHNLVRSNKPSKTGGAPPNLRVNGNVVGGVLVGD